MLLKRTPIAQNIFDAFRQGAAGGQPVAQPGAAKPAGPADASGQIPAGAAAGGAAPDLNEENKSPLAEFSGLWDDEAVPEGGTPPTNWDDFNSLVPAMNIDPKRLNEVSKRLDYSKLMNPERVKAALAGDVGAFTEVINGVMQAAFANSSMATARFTEATLKRMAPNLLEALPHHIRKHSVRETVAGDNPLFADPAAAPLLEALESRLRTKYPKASAKEISDHAKKYLGGFAQALNAPATEEALRRGQPKPGDKAGTAKDDWTDFFVPPTEQ